MNTQDYYEIINIHIERYTNSNPEEIRDAYIDAIIEEWNNALKNNMSIVDCNKKYEPLLDSYRKVCFA